MRRKEINEMIIKALTTESRKKKANCQTELENLGYEITKWNGAWHIKNTKTYRRVSLAYNNNYIQTSYGVIKFGTMWSHKHRKYVYKPIDVIDFVGFLEKPLRTDNSYWENRTNYEKLKDALWDKKFSQKTLNNALNEYTNKIEAITERYKKELERAESEYNFTVKYRTNQLENANKIISELLTR